mgnify:CR=1 FL=1
MARPPNLRQQRFAAEIKQYIADILHEAADEIPSLGEVLWDITDVRVTPDLQQVRVYLLVSPPEKMDFVVRLLNQHQKAMRYRLAQRIRHLVKVMPTVQFFVDEVELRARRIEEVLRNLPPPAKEESDGATS